MIAEDSNQTYCNSISPFGSHSICIWIRITTSGSSVGGTIRRSAAPSGGEFGAGRPGAATTAASQCCRTRSSDWWSWSWAGGAYDVVIDEGKEGDSSNLDVLTLLDGVTEPVRGLEVPYWDLREVFRLCVSRL